ncbi:MAG: P-II family nitrogen regulator [Candidatus Methanomethylophilaceae archaeon]
MKMIIAYIRPERLQNVKDALKLKNVNGMSITSVRGRGSQSGLKFTNRVGEFVVDEIEKIKLEIVVEDIMEDMVIDTVVSSASTGRIGDGRIFVLPVERSVKVRSEQV